MRWPWSHHDCNRATLTLLSDDGFVLGFPRDMSTRDMEQVVTNIRQAVKRGLPLRSIILPFPVDVIDRR